MQMDELVRTLARAAVAGSIRSSQSPTTPSHPPPVIEAAVSKLDVNCDEDFHSHRLVER
jgi:hypothetical protein